MLDNIELIWMVTGVALFFIEALLINTVFFMFVSISIFITGVMIATNIIPRNNFEIQILICLALSTLLIISLYKPIRKYFSRNINKYNDIVGRFAVITDHEIQNNSSGKAIWSGTIINVEYKNGSDVIHVGEKVEIIAVQGNRFYIKKVIER